MACRGGAARHFFRSTLSLEFVASLQTRLQEALDVWRLRQVKLIELIDATSDPTNQLRVGDWAYLAAEYTPIPSENHFRCKWAGPFPVLGCHSFHSDSDLA